MFILHSAFVSGVSAAPVNSTSVWVSWSPINLTVVDHYIVHYVYATVGDGSWSVMFPGNTTSGVVSGLQEGQQYLFSVTVTLNVKGQLYSGEVNFSIPAINGQSHPLWLHIIVLEVKILSLWWLMEQRELLCCQVFIVTQ